VSRLLPCLVRLLLPASFMGSLLFAFAPSCLPGGAGGAGPRRCRRQPSGNSAPEHRRNRRGTTGPPSVGWHRPGNRCRDYRRHARPIRGPTPAAPTARRAARAHREIAALHLHRKLTTDRGRTFLFLYRNVTYEASPSTDRNAHETSCPGTHPCSNGRFRGIDAVAQALSNMRPGSSARESPNSEDLPMHDGSPGKAACRRSRPEVERSPETARPCGVLPRESLRRGTRFTTNHRLPRH